MLCAQLNGIGGSFARSFQLGSALSGLGHDVSLVVGRRKPGIRPIAARSNDVLVVEAPGILPARLRRAGLDPIDLMSRLMVIGRRFDVIHLHSHRPTVSLHALWARNRNVPVVLDWADLVGYEGFAGERHGLLRHTLGKLDEWSEHGLPPRVDGVTAISNFLSQRARSLGVRPSHVLTLPPGADVEGISSLDSAEMRRRLGFPLDARIVGHAGFTHWDSELIGRTFVQLARTDPRILFLQIGGRFPAVEEEIRASGLAGQYKTTGFVPYADYENYLACADVFLMPYTNRPFNQARYPNKVGDFLAAGRPIVTNPTGDLAELIRKEGVGLLADATSEAMAEGVRRYLDDPELARTTGARARASAERHSWKDRARRLADFFADTIERKKAIVAR